MPRLGLGSSLTGGSVADSALSNSYSLSFDGSNQYIDIGSPSSLGLGTNNFSFSAWIQTTKAGYSWVLSMNSTNGLGIGTHNSGGLARLWIGGQVFVTDGIDIKDGDWHHYCVTREGTTLLVYIDNVVDDTATSTGSIAAGAAKIGTWSTGTDYWDGLIDEVAIWDVALDSDAVAAIYNSGTPTALDADSGNYDNSGDLIAYWRFEEGTEGSAADSSGTGITGTLTNGPTWSSDVPS